MSRACIDKNLSRQLHAYELDMLSEQERDAFECHLLECDFCFEDLKQFAPRGTILSAAPQIRQLLDEMFPQPQSGTSLVKRIWQILWPDGMPAIVRPAVLIAVLLLMIYPAQLGFRIISKPDISPVREIALMQARSPETFVVDPDQSVVLSFLCPKGEPGETYSVVLSDESRASIYTEEEYSDVDNYGVGRLLLPGRLIRPGDYKLSVRTSRQMPDEPQASEYIFHIAFSSNK
jgi:hypothetical protein